MLQEKVAVITGGSSGLGFCFARELGLKGFTIVILARRQEKIDEAIGELKGMGVKARGISCDISDEKQVSLAFEIIKKFLFKIDFLILNAGNVLPKLMSDYESAQEIKEQIDVNFYGTILCAWKFVPLMPDKSKILITSSGFGLMGAAGYTVYCATKAGLVNFADSLRRELLFRGIGVYVACPGDTDTPMLKEELESLPEWMNTTSRKSLPAEKVSKRILKQCKGNSRHIIITSTDVFLLSTMNRVLPHRLRNRILDVMLPTPQE